MKFLNFLIINLSLILQSCSMSFDGYKRSPASVESFEELTARLKTFRAKVLGSEVDANCSKEQMDADFKKLMASVKKDSCSVDNVSFDRDEFNKTACPKIKTEGYFDRIVKKTISEEKNKKPLTIFQNNVDNEFLLLNKEAQLFMKEVSTHLNNENYESSERAKLLAEYIEDVLLPIRDIVIVKRSYLPKEEDGNIFYSALQPYISIPFFKSLNSDDVGLITQGPNPGVSPFYLELEKTNQGNLRLVFSPTDIIRRDVVTLLKAPTAKNYVMALKWMTLHMMMSQVYVYDTILENKADLTLPKSCQNHFNGNLPSTFKFSFEDGSGERYLDNILAGHGLTFKDNDITFMDYYIDNINKDPTKEGFSGLVPFENYKNAHRSIETSSVAALEPQFDDNAHFQAVFSSKEGEAKSIFRGKLKGKLVSYAGLETFQKMLGNFTVNETAEIKLSTGEINPIYPGRLNLSPYLLEVMQKNGFLDPLDLLTEPLKKKFANKVVKIDFPSLYSSPVWRTWSLKLLADKIHSLEEAPPQSDIYKYVSNACAMGTRRSPELTKICFEGNVVKNLSEFMIDFRSGDKYIPTRRLEESKFRELYPFLSNLWVVLRDHLNQLPEATPFELNFLQEQLSAGNPWARLKFSYMVALDQLEHQQHGLIPKYQSASGHSIEGKEVMCSINNVTVQYNNIERAGKVLGLDKPLTYNFSGKILSTDEKKTVWKKVFDDINQRNAQLFTVKNASKNYYQMLEDISYKTILTESQALSSGASISDRAKAEIKKVGLSNQGQLGDFFLKLYKLKDPVKQQEVFEEFSAVNGIDTQFKLKLNFLALDTDFKKPIYKDLLRQSAQTRKLQILGQLDRFCKMDVNNEVEFKNIFYQTTKAQNELNEMAGLPSIPKEALEKIQEMTSSEWRDMWWGIGSGLAGLAAIVVGGACTTLTGGICTPFAAAMIGAVVSTTGVAALGIQVKLTSNEIDRKVQADLAEEQVKVMEDLGFSNSGTSDEVHRSYTWTAIEAISIFPLVKIATRSAVIGPKLMIASKNALMRNVGETSFKSVAKTITQEEEVRAAQYLLGMTSVTENVGLDSKTMSLAKENISKIKKLYTSGEINFETMMKKLGDVLAPIKRAKLAIAKTSRAEVGKVVVKQNKENIDQKAAQVITQYFSDNPREMQRLIQGYSGEKLNRALKIMSEVNASDRIGDIPIYSGMKDWFLRMRNESLAKNASKILRIEKELGALGSRPDQLEKYVRANIEDLTDIFLDIPMRKREIPYFVFVQGMPEFNFYKGQKIPILSMMSEGQSLKNIFTARARLVHEAYKAQARQVLGLSKHVKAETTFEAFKAFKMSIADLASRTTGKESQKILIDYRNLEEQLARKLHGKYKASGEKMEYKKFKNLVFNPQTRTDRATAEVIWESVPADELMKMKEVGDFAHKAVQQLANYSDIDSFERYLSALKVLTINRNSAVLEVM